MDLDSVVSSLLGSLYAASTGAKPWAAFMKGTESFLGCHAMALTAITADRRDVLLMEEHNLGEGRFLDLYAEKYVDNPWTRAGQRLPLDSATLMSRHVSPREMHAHPFHEACAIPLDLHWVMGSSLLLDDKAYAFFSAYRGQKAGDFTAGQLERCQFLVPHLKNALAIRLKLADLDARLASALEVLHRLDVALLILDRGGRVIFRNRAAERLLQGGDGLWVRKGFLEISDRIASRQVNLAIGRATGRLDGAPVARGGGCVVVPRPSCRRDYVVMVSPLLDHGVMCGANRPEALVMISDPGRPRLPPAVLMQRIFGLSPREAELASLLASGTSLEDAADRLEMTTGTARSYLKAVFWKTETHRQAELAVILGNTIPIIDGVETDGEA
jgi:DNA-binding CsgD family transcriptional regulator/PAS domain-containing protein